jgi:hypothetical protein
MLILEIAAGVFLGLWVFHRWTRWYTQRVATRADRAVAKMFDKRAAEREHYTLTEILSARLAVAIGDIRQRLYNSSRSD